MTVEVPATSANLGPGFDCLGLALDLTDEVTLSVGAVEGPDVVEISGECADTLPRDESHLILRTARNYFAEVGYVPGPLRLQTTNRIPHGRGLGSSSAAVVGALRAGAAIVGAADADLFQLAAGIEGHPDNVAPCLYGGFTASWYEANRGRSGYRCVAVPPHPEILVTVALPHAELSTKQARGMLPESVPFRDAAANSARAALVMHAFTRDPGLLLTATEDYLHQRYRASAYAESYALVGGLRERSVAAAISGAGPSVIAFTTGAPIHQGLVDTIVGAGIFTVRQASVRSNGARVIASIG